MTAGLIVRDITAADYDAWQPLWNGYNAFYQRVGTTALPQQVTEATWRRFFDAAEPVYALVAESDHRLIGIAHYLFHRSTTALQPVCYLQDLFTAAERRGGGVGRALIEAVASRAHAAGATRLYWQTHESNLVAQHLYNKVAQRSGFIVYRRDLPGDA